MSNVVAILKVGALVGGAALVGFVAGKRPRAVDEVVELALGYGAFTAQRAALALGIFPDEPASAAALYDRGESVPPSR